MNSLEMFEQAIAKLKEEMQGTITSPVVTPSEPFIEHVITLEEENKCKHCDTDLDEVREAMAGESLEDIAEVIQDCTRHNPNFDPDDYKTWPEGYMGTLVDRARDSQD